MTPQKQKITCYKNPRVCESGNTFKTCYKNPRVCESGNTFKTCYKNPRVCESGNIYRIGRFSESIRFAYKNVVSRKSLLRIVINKSHCRTNHERIMNLRTNHERIMNLRTNQEHWNESETPPPVENDPSSGK